MEFVVDFNAPDNLPDYEGAPPGFRAQVHAARIFGAARPVVAAAGVLGKRSPISDNKDDISLDAEKRVDRDAAEFLKQNKMRKTLPPLPVQPLAIPGTRLDEFVEERGASSGMDVIAAMADRFRQFEHVVETTEAAMRRDVYDVFGTNGLRKFDAFIEERNASLKEAGDDRYGIMFDLLSRFQRDSERAEAVAQDMADDLHVHARPPQPRLIDGVAATMSDQLQSWALQRIEAFQEDEVVMSTLMGMVADASGGDPSNEAAVAAFERAGYDMSHPFWRQGIWASTNDKEDEYDDDDDDDGSSPMEMGAPFDKWKQDGENDPNPSMTQMFAAWWSGDSRLRLSTDEAALLPEMWTTNGNFVAFHLNMIPADVRDSGGLDGYIKRIFDGQYDDDDDAGAQLRLVYDAKHAHGAMSLSSHWVISNRGKEVEHVDTPVAMYLPLDKDAVEMYTPNEDSDGSMREDIKKRFVVFHDVQGRVWVLAHQKQDGDETKSALIKCAMWATYKPEEREVSLDEMEPYPIERNTGRYGRLEITINADSENDGMYSKSDLQLLRNPLTGTIAVGVKPPNSEPMLFLLTNNVNRVFVKHNGENERTLTLRMRGLKNDGTERECVVRLQRGTTNKAKLKNDIQEIYYSVREMTDISLDWTDDEVPKRIDGKGALTDVVGDMVARQATQGARRIVQGVDENKLSEKTEDGSWPGAAWATRSWGRTMRFITSFATFEYSFKTASAAVYEFFTLNEDLIRLNFEKKPFVHTLDEKELADVSADFDVLWGQETALPVRRATHADVILRTTLYDRKKDTYMYGASWQPIIHAYTPLLVVKSGNEEKTYPLEATTRVSLLAGYPGAVFLSLPRYKEDKRIVGRRGLVFVFKDEEAGWLWGKKQTAEQRADAFSREVRSALRDLRRPARQIGRFLKYAAGAAGAILTSIYVLYFFNKIGEGYAAQLGEGYTKISEAQEVVEKKAEQFEENVETLIKDAKEISDTITVQQDYYLMSADIQALEKYVKDSPHFDIEEAYKKYDEVFTPFYKKILEAEQKRETRYGESFEVERMREFLYLALAGAGTAGEGIAGRNVEYLLEYLNNTSSDSHITFEQRFRTMKYTFSSIAGSLIDAHRGRDVKDTLKNAINVRESTFLVREAMGDLKDALKKQSSNIMSIEQAVDVGRTAIKQDPSVAMLFHWLGKVTSNRALIYILGEGFIRHFGEIARAYSFLSKNFKISTVKNFFSALWNFDLSGAASLTLDLGGCLTALYKLWSSFGSRLFLNTFGARLWKWSVDVFKQSLNSLLYSIQIVVETGVSVFKSSVSTVRGFFEKIRGWVDSFLESFLKILGSTLRSPRLANFLWNAAGSCCVGSIAVFSGAAAVAAYYTKQVFDKFVAKALSSERAWLRVSGRLLSHVPLTTLFFKFIFGTIIDLDVAKDIVNMERGLHSRFLGTKYEDDVSAFFGIANDPMVKIFDALQIAKLISPGSKMGEMLRKGLFIAQTEVTAGAIVPVRAINLETLLRNMNM